MMSRLFFKYYLDVTKYNLIFCAFIFILHPGILELIILFATVGGLVSFVMYRYFQNIEYYFYINRGISKSHLQTKTAAINLLISSLLVISWTTYYR